VSSAFLDELKWRGLLHQTTASETELAKHLATPGRVAYAGFDPTKDSLTIGHLIPIRLLKHWQRAGHSPIALMGGGTGLIGDPSGRDSERQLLSREEIDANVVGQQRVLTRFLDFDAARSNRATVLNNADWLVGLGFVEMLREIGKHFSVNAMLQKDSVRARLENREQGISYTEFSYMLLQAYDFLHLRRTRQCSVQLSGSDQYGNVVAGVDLIHHKLGRDSEAGDAFGITAPLLLGSDGKKIGKTAQGAVWLTADRTSPYAFYQYWINVADADVVAFLKLFTSLEREAIEPLAEQHARAPHERHAQRALAREMTELVHGREELTRVEAASQALFGGDVRALDAAMLSEVFADVPHTVHDKGLLAGNGVALSELLPHTSLVSSKSQARQFLESGAISVNGARASADQRLTERDLLHANRILLRRGKKQWHATQWG
jgi:tyrosyl-tRNA synthetase